MVSKNPGYQAARGKYGSPREAEMLASWCAVQDAPSKPAQRS